jgi:putative SOS response-associated peptidase YedK
VCGRVRLTGTEKRLAQLFEAKYRGEFQAAVNIKPTQAVVVLLDDRGERVLERMQWGLVPSWAKDRRIASKLFNARSETVHEKPSFRSAFRSRRCGIVVDAFYEWLTVETARVPHEIRVAGAEAFTLAGLWEEWCSPDGEIVRSCTIITTAANEQVRWIHDRMPAILAGPALAAWLDPKTPADSLRALLVPFDGALTIEPTRL